MARKPRVRPLALCIFQRDDAIFVAEGRDKVKDETFYRPLGGRIEFGEYAADTVRRELMEEIGAEVRDLQYLGTLENIFIYQGEPRHELVLMFEGAFCDERLYDADRITDAYSDGELLFHAMWKPLSGFRTGAALLYPLGLLELLDRGSTPAAKE